MIDYDLGEIAQEAEENRLIGKYKDDAIDYKISLLIDKKEEIDKIVYGCHINKFDGEAVITDLKKFINYHTDSVEEFIRITSDTDSISKMYSGNYVSFNDKTDTTLACLNIMFESIVHDTEITDDEVLEYAYEYEDFFKE